MVGESRRGRSDGDVLDGQHRIHALIKCFGEVELKFHIDTPIDPAGEWWIDLSIGDYSTTIAWQADKGFGIYTSDDDAYGARPDEVFREPELAAKRLKQLAAKTGQSAMRLSDVRKLLDKPQTLLAGSLKKDQGAISKLERQNDALLSSVKSYIEALGGKVKLVVQFDGFEAPIDVPAATKRVVIKTGVNKRTPKVRAKPLRRIGAKKNAAKAAVLTCR